MKTNKKTLLQISLLIDKMNLLVENFLESDSDVDQRDVELLENYNARIQNLLLRDRVEDKVEDRKQERQDIRGLHGAVPIASAPVLAAEPEIMDEAVIKESPEFLISPEEAVISEPIIESEAEEEIYETDSVLEDDSVELTEVVPSIEAISAETPAPSIEAEYSEPNISMEAPEAEEIVEHIETTEPEIAVNEVNHLFPDDAHTVAEAAEESLGVNDIYETKASTDLNDTFSEETASIEEDVPEDATEESTVEEYAENIQDQIMNTIKGLGTPVAKAGAGLTGAVAAGAAALGLNKEKNTPEETISEPVEDTVQNYTEPTVEATAPPVIEEDIPAINEAYNTTDDSFFDFTEINLKEEEPVGATEPAEPELNDRFNATTTSVEVSEKLKKSFAGDLKQNIDINDRFTFIQTLFNGDYSAFDGTIGSINKCSTYGEAVELLEQKVITKYRWNEKEEVASQFIEIIRQKFIS